MKSLSHWVTRRTVLIVLATVVVVCLYGLYSRVSFVFAYNRYAYLSELQNTYAFAPSVEANPIRNELNRVLSEILTKPMSDSERLALATQGLTLIQGMERQVDRIGDQGLKVEKALNNAEFRGSAFGNIFARGHIRELFFHARTEAAVIEDIRGLSYRANYHTQNILKRVVADSGSLAKAHIAELNSELPELEAQFDKRTNLYTKLQSEHSQVQKLFRDTLGATLFTDVYMRYFQEPLGRLQ